MAALHQTKDSSITDPRKGTFTAEVGISTSALTANDCELAGTAHRFPMGNCGYHDELNVLRFESGRIFSMGSGMADFLGGNLDGLGSRGGPFVLAGYSRYVPTPPYGLAQSYRLQRCHRFA